MNRELLDFLRNSENPIIVESVRKYLPSIPPVLPEYLPKTKRKYGYPMGYETYCKAWEVRLTSPIPNDHFYQNLDRIAIQRSAVLAEIERMPIRNLSRLGTVVSRGMDLLLCSFGFLVLAIPCLIISIVIKLTSSGPIFYRQARVGKNGKVFQIIKFRTM